MQSDNFMLAIFVTFNGQFMPKVLLACKITDTIYRLYEQWG